MTKKGVIGTEKGGMAEEGCDFRREINQVVFFARFKLFSTV